MQTILTAGFRNLYQEIVLVKLPETFDLSTAQGFPAEGANAMLLYGTVNHRAGLFFHLLTLVKLQGRLVHLLGGNDQVNVAYAMKEVCNLELVEQQLTESSLAKFSEKILLIDYANQERSDIEGLRMVERLDPFRFIENPDDLEAYLLKDGLEPERVWLRCEGMRNQKPVGELLNEPEQDFTVHEGDIVPFGLMEQEGQTFCVSIIE